MNQPAPASIPTGRTTHYEALADMIGMLCQTGQFQAAKKRLGALAKHAFLDADLRWIRDVFDKGCDLEKRGQEVNEIAIAAALGFDEHRKRLLLNWADAAPLGTRWEPFVDRVAEMAVRERATKLTWEALAALEAGQLVSAEQFLSEARAVTGAWSAGSAPKREIVLGNGDQLLEMAKNARWLSGWEMWGGLGGNVTIIFGAPKVGKTGWLRWMLAETLHFGRAGISGKPGQSGKVWVAAFSDAGGAQYIKSLEALQARPACALLFDRDYYDQSGPKDDAGKPIATGEATQLSAHSEDHWRRITHLAEKHGENLILTIDDLLGWTGCGDLNTPDAAAPVRRLAGICERFGSVPYVVAHSRKPNVSKDGTAFPISLDDLSGHRSLQQYARAFIGIWVPDPSRSNEIRAEWLPSNYAPEQAPVGFRRLDGDRFERMTTLPIQPARMSEEEKAETWLEAELRNGKATWEDLEVRGRENEHAGRTLQRARSNLKGHGLIRSWIDLGPPKHTYWGLSDKAAELE